MPSERVLLGPGPSPVSARVLSQLAGAVVSHLDPEMVDAMDDVRRKLGVTFGAADGAFSFAVSGTGTSGLETAVANVTRVDAPVLVAVTGYFGDRLAQVFERYGAKVARVDGEWGRAIDPAAVERALRGSGAEIVGCVHAETSTGVLNPVGDIAAVAKRQGAMTVVDAVTSLGAIPVNTAAWDVDVCYSCSQKGLGAPPGLAPVTFASRVLERRTPCRSFYLDAALLQDYWVRRRYHHTMSSSLVFALREALTVVEEEGLENRYARHERHHRALVGGIESLGLSLLPPPGERLWTLNAIRVPDQIDEAAVRRRLLQEFQIEIGAGLGPLAGRIWRVGLMGAGSTLANVLLFLSAFERCLRAEGYTPRAANATLAAVESAG
jgi:alanine-glyoxylate transaminase / serine-glyoxylate transaminase / serine-pyruvate transaminase